MSTGQSAVMRCGWGVKEGWVAGKTVILVKTCHSERFRGEFSRKGAILMFCLQLILQFLRSYPRLALVTRD